MLMSPKNHTQNLSLHLIIELEILARGIICSSTFKLLNDGLYLAVPTEFL